MVIISSRNIFGGQKLLNISMDWIFEVVLINKTRQTLHVWRYKEAHSCNHRCGGKAISNTFWECVCSVRYPACSAHDPYCHLWPARIYSIFPHYLINGTVFKKISLNTKRVFDFLYNFCLKHFSFSEEVNEIRSKKNYWSWRKIPAILVRL
jgi:hypothetical protein